MVTSQKLAETSFFPKSETFNFLFQPLWHHVWHKDVWGPDGYIGWYIDGLYSPTLPLVPSGLQLCASLDSTGETLEHVTGCLSSETTFSVILYTQHSSVRRCRDNKMTEKYQGLCSYVFAQTPMFCRL